MQRRLLAAAGVLGFALAAGAGAARADLPHELHVKVPFNFVVGKTTLPAGEYTLRNPSPEILTLVEIRSDDGRNTVIFETVPELPKNSDLVDHSALDFRKINGKEYLASIWESGTGEGDALPLPMAHARPSEVASQSR